MSRELYQAREKTIRKLTQVNKESMLNYIESYMDEGTVLYVGDNYIDIALNDASGLVTIYSSSTITSIKASCPTKMPSNKEEAIKMFDELALLTKVARQAYIAYRYWRG